MCRVPLYIVGRLMTHDYNLIYNHFLMYFYKHYSVRKINCNFIDSYGDVFFSCSLVLIVTHLLVNFKTHILSTFIVLIGAKSNVIFVVFITFCL